jgi:hypothetical protein
MKRTKRAIALLLLAYAVLEMSAFFGLVGLRALRHVEYTPATSLTDRHKRILQEFLAGKTHYIGYSSTLGWTLKPNGFSSLYRANSRGIRGNREYALIPTANSVRIAAFGDSFTHGDSVKNEDTWEEFLMSETEGVEALNFGVGGFGLDQALLRYQQEGVSYHPHIVLIGFMSENILRHVNVFRPFYSPVTEEPLTKPRYMIENGSLVLLKNPMQELSQYEELLVHPEEVLSRLGGHDYFYRMRSKRGPFDFLPVVRLSKLAWQQYMQRKLNIVQNGYYDKGSEAFQVTTGIVDEFVAVVRSHGSRPVVVVFPNRWDLQRYRRDGTKEYAPLLEHLRAKGYPYVDVLDGFDTYGREIALNEIIPSHYGRLGNRLAAKTISHYLAENGLLDRGPVTRP